MAVLEYTENARNSATAIVAGFRCVDPDHIGGRLSPEELASARKSIKALAIGEGNRNYDASDAALVECEVCDRSHAPSHPHIANIDGDVPIDDSDLGDAPQPAPIARELPDWLKDKPGSQMIRPAAEPSANNPTCGVCGEPWASRHVCKGAEPPGMSAFNPPIVKAHDPRRAETSCVVCGKIKRSNHVCKGAPPAEKPCVYCERAGEPCVRHGGERSSVRTAKRFQTRQEADQSPAQPQADGRAAKELPKPVSAAQPAAGEAQELDRELAAIGTILAALDGLSVDEVKRAFAYVADRKGIKQEPER